MSTPATIPVAPGSDAGRVQEAVRAWAASVSSEVAALQVQAASLSAEIATLRSIKASLDAVRYPNPPSSLDHLTTTEALTAAIAAHEAAGDPHPGYLTAAEGNAAYVAKGGTLASVATAPPNDGVIAALTFTAVPTGAECEALRDQCEIVRRSYGTT